MLDDLPKVMLAKWYKHSQGGYIIFIKHMETRGLTALLVYVDDIIVTSNKEKERSIEKNV